MKKRGLSAVVTTLILVLLVIVAIAIIWAVINNLIREKADDIGATAFEISMSIKTVEPSTAPENVKVRIERNVGDGDLQGINIIMSDGIKSETVRVNPINEGEEEIYDISKGGLGTITKVSIRPIGGSGSNEKVGEIVSEKELSYEQSVKSLGGLVAWWKLDSDAKDSSGSVPPHDGTLLGGVNCNVERKVDKACDFDGVDDAVSIPDHDDLDITSSKTFVLWFKAPASSANTDIFGKDGNTPTGTRSYFFRWSTSPPTGLYFRTFSDPLLGSGGMSLSKSVPLNFADKWHFIAIVVNSPGNSLLYLDDEAPSSTVTVLPQNVDAPLGIGGDFINPITFTKYYDSTIDELMIFNRALTPDEVKSIYELTK